MKKILSRENIIKILLMLFGLTFFPVIIYFVSIPFKTNHEGIIEYYSQFYKSLLDMGMDGFIAWMIACIPYIIYEVLLLVKPFFWRKNEGRDRIRK